MTRKHQADADMKLRLSGGSSPNGHTYSANEKIVREFDWAPRRISENTIDVSVTTGAKKHRRCDLIAAKHTRKCAGREKCGQDEA